MKPQRLNRRRFRAAGFALAAAPLAAAETAHAFARGFTEVMMANALGRAMSDDEGHALFAAGT